MLLIGVNSSSHPPLSTAHQPPLFSAAAAVQLPESHSRIDPAAVMQNQRLHREKGRPGSPLMHWQPVHTCLIEAGVCCAHRAKDQSTTIRTLTGLALSETAASHPLSCLDEGEGGEGGGSGSDAQQRKLLFLCACLCTVKSVKAVILILASCPLLWIFIPKLSRVAPGEGEGRGGGG